MKKTILAIVAICAAYGFASNAHAKYGRSTSSFSRPSYSAPRISPPTTRPASRPSYTPPRPAYTPPPRPVYRSSNTTIVQQNVVRQQSSTGSSMLSGVVGGIAAWGVMQAIFGKPDPAPQPPVQAVDCSKPEVQKLNLTVCQQ